MSIGVSLTIMDERERQLIWRYLVSVLCGGIAGTFAIIFAVFADLDWKCKHWNKGCYDGQGGIVLVVLVPIMFAIGGLPGSLWTFLRSKLSSRSVLAIEYPGPMELQSRILRLAVPAALWCLIGFLLFKSLVYLEFWPA